MRMLKKRNRLSLALFLLATGYSLLTTIILSGCGYTTRSIITQDYQTIYVRPFANKIDITSETSVARKYKTYHPLLENDITRQIIDQFILDGNLKLAKEEDADLILEGELIGYRRDALRYMGSNDKEVEEYRVNLIVNLNLYDVSSQDLLWNVKNFVGDATYFTQEESESSAISRAVSDLARRIVDRVIDIW